MSDGDVFRAGTGVFSAEPSFVLNMTSDTRSNACSDVTKICLQLHAHDGP